MELQLFLHIANASERIIDNASAIKNHSKDQPNNVKAYSRLAEGYNMELDGSDPIVLDKYQKYQDELLYIQQQVLLVMGDSSKSMVCNSQLKGEKDLERIRLSFGIVKKE